MNKQTCGGWGEIEAQAQPLNYPGFLDSERCRQKQIKEARKREAARYKKRQKLKNKIITAAWAVCLVGMGVALIVWG